MIINKTTDSRLATFDQENFTFGNTFSDHMVVCEYQDGKWGDIKLMPYGPLPFTPAMMGVHYGQAAFEGMKAYKDADGEVFLFRPERNFHRMNKSAVRLAMPEVTEEMFIGGLKALVDIDRGWVPHGEGFSLYLRPVLFATEEALQARISTKFMFAIMATPARAYYPKPIAVKVSDHFSRSANGGVGYAKAAGNYGGSFYPTLLAQEEGYDQVIWTDDCEHKYFEESGTMNVMVRINDTIITPKTSEKILDGVTRDSILKVAEHLGVKTEVRDLAVEEVYNAHKNGELKEAFGVGTAVVMSMFKEIGYKEERLALDVLPEDESVAQQLKKFLTDLQANQGEDPFGWRVKVEKGYADQFLK
ncbi:MAG: branched-chain amino acid aminotransferase [Chryseobacterium sp.]|nr:MAG: branched-chain amino acid aminotransferase [Chryseobacterium sp.]